MLPLIFLCKALREACSYTVYVLLQLHKPIVWCKRNGPLFHYVQYSVTEYNTRQLFLYTF